MQQLGIDDCGYYCNQLIDTYRFALYVIICQVNRLTQINLQASESKTFGCLIIGACFLLDIANYLDLVRAVGLTINFDQNQVYFILICVGLFMVILSCFGLIGQCSHIKILIYVYIAFVSALFVGELVIVILLNSNEVAFKDTISGSLTPIINTGSSISQQTIANIQDTFRCCGINNPNDLDSIPSLSSSCRNREQPCLTAINEKIELYVKIMTGGGSALMVVQIIAIVTSLFI
ncbi:hypothetical protein GJ496_009351 [Pomphorhynchus laevis]|nr:hypothetical protein GJ496_009351 [Pomphorhynchus laevis]